MDTKLEQLPLVAIVGQTASGKSALALKIATSFNGAVICADSRTVYLSMDIGTAKPTSLERSRILHYGLDLVKPSEPYSVADYQHYANKVLAELSKQQRLPVLVGGTGLYVDSVLYDFDFSAKPDYKLRARLELKTVEELQSEVNRKGLPMPPNHLNKRHLIRTIETNGQQTSRGLLRPKTLLIGLSVPKEVLRLRIERRVTAMFEAGLEAEVKGLEAMYGWQAEALSAIGYKEFLEYFDGESSLEDVKRHIITNSIQYAKRQATWFKRNPDIVWFDDGALAYEYACQWLKQE